MKHDSKLRLAWFSPLPHDEGGASCTSAYVSSLLLPFLAKHFALEVFCNNFSSFADYTTHHHLTAFQRHKDNPFDLFFYQLEDHISSRFVRMYLGCMPGAVLFHDFIFCDHGPEPMLNSSWRETVARFHDESHAWASREVRHQNAGALALREGGLSALALFSNERAHAEYKRSVEHSLIKPHNGDAMSFFLPLPVPESCFDIDRGGFSATLGYCGLPRIEYRAHKFFSALKALKEPYKLIWLIEEGDRQACLELLREFGISSVELVAGRSAQKWQEILPRIDIAVHTLFSVYGSPGPYLAMSLASGAPCIVTNFGATEYLPESVVFKIEPGDTESLQLCQVLQRLLARGIAWEGDLQREYAREQHYLPGVAGQLVSVLKGRAGRLNSVMQRWKELERDARRELLRESRELFLKGEPDLGASECAFIEPKQFWAKSIEPIFEEFSWKV